jgi:hypothetical protein
VLAFLLLPFPPRMRGDTWPAFGQAHRTILCAEYGLQFLRDAEPWQRVA